MHTKCNKCLTCSRPLLSGRSRKPAPKDINFCSIGCKVKHCTGGEPIGNELPRGMKLGTSPPESSDQVLRLSLEFPKIGSGPSRLVVKLKFPSLLKRDCIGNKDLTQNGAAGGAAG